MIRIDADSEFLTLSRYIDVIAASSGSGTGWATKSDWLAPLSRDDPLRAPSTHDRIREPARVVQELFILAERELITAAEVEDVSQIEVGETTVKLWTKSRNVRRTIASAAAAIEQVARVSKCLRPGVSQKEAQSIRKLLLQFRLQSVIRALSDSCVITRPMPEIRERDFVHARGD